MSDRTDFSEHVAALVLWVRDNCNGYRLAFAEAGVYFNRNVRFKGAVGAEEKILGATDAVHRRGSFHYKMLAVDLDLFDPSGIYITDGDHPVWKAIAQKWESMHVKATSGRRWNDANHCSWGEGSKVEPLPD